MNAVNHLADASSPYLLQHAENPVDWHPWCGEAFERARREDKPVFLSIGYSACHWCHYDATCGGFGDAPKFPSPQNLLFLLRYWHREQEQRALSMVENTLRIMARSGVYDAVGFGFHRYSTDRQWRVPHFEKMLYDHTMLLCAVDFALGPTSEVVLASEKGQSDLQEMVTSLSARFLPRTVVLCRHPDNAEQLGTVAPFTAEQGPFHDAPTAYVCRNQLCTDPVTDPADLLELLAPTAAH